MSPTDTSIEKQSRRHRPALLGLAVAVASVVVVIVAIMAFGADEVVDEASSGELVNETQPVGTD